MPDPYPYTKVLIPYDGSPTARRALKFAAALAGEQRDRVGQFTLLRVIAGGYLARHIQNVDLRVTRLAADPAWERIRQHHVDTVVLPDLEEGRRLLTEQGVKATITTRVAEGKVGEVIIKLAEDEGFTAIVMGRRGLSPLKEVLLGSVTRQVLLTARGLTLFVVGQEAAFPADCPFPTVLLPVDGSEASLAAVRQAAALARVWPTCSPMLHLLQVVDVAQITAAMDQAEVLVQRGEEILQHARRLLVEEGLAPLIQDNLRAGDPTRVIIEEADHLHTPLILMGARGLSPLKQLLLGSVSQGVLHGASGCVVGVVYL
jgi:nucleotide-binding universal stress UspA family protein